MAAPDRIIAQRATNWQWYRKPHATATSRRVHRLAAKRRRQELPKLDER